MQVRDRIKELRRVRAAELRPNPRNWRLHPGEQQDALRRLLADQRHQQSPGPHSPLSPLAVVEGGEREENRRRSVQDVL